MASLTSIVQLPNKAEIKHYEELKGGQGRRIFYRPTRFRARDTFKAAIPSVYLGEAEYTLHDMSTSGLSVFSARGAENAPDVQTHVPIRVDYHAHTLFEGIALVVRSEPTPFGTKLGLQLTQTPLDLKRLIARYNDAVLHYELGQVQHRQAVDMVSPAYRQLCADTLFLIREYKTLLDRFDANQGSNGVINRQQQIDMISLCEEKILPAWDAIWFEANALVRPLMDYGQAYHATKHYTEQVLTPALMDGPMWQRSYVKPLGYPGDYIMMNYVYDWGYEGETSFGVLMHRVAVHIGAFLRSRMETMKACIAEEILTAKSDVVHISCIGAGSAQEIVNYLSQPKLPKRVHFTLIDQDEQALSCAYNNVHPHILRLRGQATVSCLHTSFLELIKVDDVFKTLPPQQMIYSIGLVDYLSEKRLREFVKALAGRVLDNGRIVIANMRDTPKGQLWPLEFVADWNLIYRNESEMRIMVADTPSLKIDIKEDPSGCVYFADMRKMSPS